MTETIELDSIEAHVVLLRLREQLEAAENTGIRSSAAVIDDILTRLEADLGVQGVLVMTESTTLAIESGDERAVIEKALSVDSTHRLAPIVDDVLEKLTSTTV